MGEFFHSSYFFVIGAFITLTVFIAYLLAFDRISWGNVVGKFFCDDFLSSVDKIDSFNEEVFVKFNLLEACLCYKNEDVWNPLTAV